MIKEVKSVKTISPIPFTKEQVYPHIIEQVNWTAGIFRPEIDFEIFEISTRIKETTITDIKAIKK